MGSFIISVHTSQCVEASFTVERRQHSSPALREPWGGRRGWLLGPPECGSAAAAGAAAGAAPALASAYSWWGGGASARCACRRRPLGPPPGGSWGPPAVALLQYGPAATSLCAANHCTTRC